MERGTGELFDIGTGTDAPPRDARGRFIPRGVPAGIGSAPLVVVDFPGAPAVPFHRGTGLLIGWTRRGAAPAGTWHPNELVADYLSDRHALILTGGKTYGRDTGPDASHLIRWGGRLCRILPLSTTRGVTRQIRGVW